jgi:peptidoglycan hydrolase FlgJ
MIENIVSVRQSGASTPQQSLADLRAAAEAFEAIFLRQMIGSMRQAQLTEGGVFSDQSSAPFRDMADARIADDMAGHARLGIADMLTRQFAAHVSAQSVSAEIAPS